MAELLSTEIFIHATPERVWTILTDFAKYPDWNPFIRSVIGEVKVGNRIVVKIGADGSKPMTFKPKVLVLEPGKRLTWLGHLWIPGLFDGEHRFEISDNGDASITFRHSESFKGLLVPLLKKKLNTEVRKGFEAMNEKLKELAEKK